MAFFEIVGHHLVQITRKFLKTIKMHFSKTKKQETKQIYTKNCPAPSQLVGNTKVNAKQRALMLSKALQQRSSLCGSPKYINNSTNIQFQKLKCNLLFCLPNLFFQNMYISYVVASHYTPIPLKINQIHV